MAIGDISIAKARPALPLVNFTWSPQGSGITYIIGGDSYAYVGLGPRFAAYITPTNTLITFTSVVTTVSSISIVKYLWNFGDGNYGAGTTAGHTYVAPIPNIEASLTITDNLGRQVTRNKVLNLRHSNQVGVGTFITRPNP